MFNISKRHLVWGLVALCALMVGLTTQQQVQAVSNKADKVKAAYIIDAKTGQAVYARNEDQKRPIASLSKLMTLYLVKKALAKGQIKWNDDVPIQKNVRKMATSATLSVMPMPAKEKFTVKELFEATLVGSSNSGAIALGEYVAGSNAKFIAMMNAQAKKWGLAADFISASGLDNTDLTTYHLDLKGTGEQAQNMVSARAITTIARHLITEFPEVITMADQGKVKIHKYTVPTSVQIIKGQKFYDPRVPADGLKTGYTNQAGACLVATFKQNGRRMIATTLGAEWKFTANNNLRLMLKASERYQNVVPKTIQYQVPGTNTKVQLVTKDGVRFWENTQHPYTVVREVVWPLHRTRPNYLGAKTAVLKLHLTDPQSGVTRSVVYQTTTAHTLLGPLQWATTPPTTTPLRLNTAFAMAN